MIHALVWKEYREQRIAWAALALVGAAALFGLPFLLTPGAVDADAAARDWLTTAVAMVAWAYGLVCGAMLLAGEREMGTQPFLDALPGLRTQVWLGKFLAGFTLVLAQVALLAGLAAAAHVFGTWVEGGLALLGLTVAGMFGLAWGLLFSSLGRSVLNMILLALAGQLVAAFLFLIPAAILSAAAVASFGLPPETATGLAWLALAGVSIPAALACSALVFTRPDRGRVRPTRPAPAIRPGTPPGDWSRLFWLAGRQSRGFAAGMAVFALLLGLLATADGVILWPAGTLLVGVLCGATAFADEQQGPFRFLGDQRFPLFRYWLVKVGLRFLIAAAAALIVLLPLAIAGVADTAAGAQRFPNNSLHVLAFAFHSTLTATVIPVPLFLTAWLVHGFCAGCLCGLLFRNGLASGVFSLFLGTVTAAVWVPSMLHGGLHAWQVFGAPVLLLLSTPFLLRPWAADRIVSRTTAARLSPFAALAVLWTAAGLWYRVWEIPNVPEPYDLASFRASLPADEQNQGGELDREACAQFEELSQKLASDRLAVAQGGVPVPVPPAAGTGQPPPAVHVAPGAAQSGQKPPLSQRVEETVRHGWAGDDPELAAWLDALCAGDWVQKLKEAADLPPGMISDLRNETAFSPDRAAGPAQQIGVVLAARGLQRQAVGDDEAYVENLRIGLALSRALRVHGQALDAGAGRSVEDHLVQGLGPWMEKLNGRPDLLRRALGLLTDYFDRADDFEADLPVVNYLIARNSLDDPLSWLPVYLTWASNLEGPFDRNDELVRTEAQALAVTGRLVPWENERQERLLRLFFSGAPPTDPTVLANRGSPVGMLDFLTRPLPPVGREVVCRDRAAQIELALRWFQADAGRPAERLDELVPKYLPAIPTDPYDGRPFRYRLSRGEEILLPEPVGAPGAPASSETLTARKVPAGQGILWCAGDDLTDDGKRRQSANAPQAPRSPGEGLIFLVPLPPAAK